jgi:small subunit ribosomal protein S16
VVLDSRKRRDGAYLANLGYYNPFVEPPEVSLHTDDILGWLAKGATVSETARSLLKREGVLYQRALIKEGLDAAEIERRMTEWREGAAARIDRREHDRRRRLEQIEEAEQQRRREKNEAKAAEAAGEAADEAAASEAAASEAAAAEESGESGEAEAAEGDAS